MNVLYRFSPVFLRFPCTGLDAQNWNPLNNMPSPRHHPVTFSLNGTGYMLTGSTQTESTTKDFYSYDPSNDTWTQRTDFPGTARGLPSAHPAGPGLHGLWCFGQRSAERSLGDRLQTSGHNSPPAPVPDEDTRRLSLKTARSTSTGRRGCGRPQGLSCIRHRFQ